jgi:cytochrome P450
VCIGEANRDESVFPDPGAFDITRPPQRQTAFGFGPHICIGQHLARMELVMATNTLLDRLPALRLDPDMPPPEIRGLTLRGAEHVHVCFG